MTLGVTADLTDLIALQRYAQTLLFRPVVSAMRTGQHVSRSRGRGMGFAEARNYKAGDEIRHMEWRVTARTGKPHVKIYQEERERPVVILTDFSPSMYFGTRVALKSVVAARLAALLAWTAVKQNDRVGGLIVSPSRHPEFTPRAREAGVLPFLAALSQYTHDDGRSMEPRSLSHALLRLRRVAKPGSVVVLISDFYTMDEESEQHLNRLRGHNDILAYHVCDPLELAPPKPQRYAVTDGQQSLMLDTSVTTVRQSYQRYCDERVAALKVQFQRLQIQYSQVTAASDLPLLVRLTFPRRSYV